MQNLPTTQRSAKIMRAYFIVLPLIHILITLGCRKNENLEEHLRIIERRLDNYEMYQYEVQRIVSGEHYSHVSPIILSVHKNTIIYVESDGRSISCIDTETGAIKWTTNPFEDWQLKPYRILHPVIRSLKYDAKKEYILIQYNSSQFGYIRLIDGKGESWGQD
jgi:hypothetical protein